MKILVDVENGEKIEKLKASVAAMGEQILKTNAAMKAQGATMEQVAAALSPLNEKLRAAATEFKQLERSAGMSGQGLMQLGYAVDDIQYGFGAIVNNIPQLVAGLGMSAGVAGVAGIAAVAVSQLYKHWSDLVSAFGSGWESPAVTGLQKMKEAADAAAEAYKKIPEPGAVRAAGTGASKVFAEGPKEAIVDAVMRKMSGALDQFAPLTKSEKSRISSADEAAKQWAVIHGPDNFMAQQAQRERQRASMRQTQSIKTQAENLVGEATTSGGGEARRRIAEMVPGLASQMEALSPEGQKRQKDFETKLKVDKEVQEKIKKANQEHAKSLDKELEASRRAGKSREEQEKDDEAERAMWLKDIGHIQQEQGKRKRTAKIQALEDESEALMKSRRKEMESLHDMKNPTISGSAHEMVNKLQQAALDLYPKQQLDKLKSIDGRLEKIHDAIKNERRKATFG